MYLSAQKWAFYFGKSADFLFRISVWSVEFCVVANRSRAFFGVRDFVLRTLFIFGGIKMDDEKSIFERMFDEVGEKIKTISQVLCWLGIVGYVVASIFMFVNAADSYSDKTLYNTLGWIFLIVGPIASWLSSLLLYGFGELISKISNLEKFFCSNVESFVVDSKQDMSTKESKAFICTSCGEVVYQGESSCKKCGQKFDWSNIQ